MSTLHLKKTSMHEPTPKKQWSQLVGTQVEVITKVGYVINGWVEVSQTHVLTVIEASKGEIRLRMNANLSLFT